MNAAYRQHNFKAKKGALRCHSPLGLVRIEKHDRAATAFILGMLEKGRPLSHETIRQIECVALRKLRLALVHHMEDFRPTPAVSK